MLLERKSYAIAMQKLCFYNSKVASQITASYYLQNQATNTFEIKHSNNQRFLLKNSLGIPLEISIFLSSSASSMYFFCGNCL